MNVLGKKKIVLLGMMSHMPVGGNIWLVVQYLLGFQRLGYDVYYVEEHGINPGMLMTEETDDSCALASEFLTRVLSRFDLGNRWAFHALHADGRYYGMSESKVKELYRSAELLINLHGGTVPLPEHAETGRLIYLGTDPVELEVELAEKRPETIAFLEPHRTFFTWGLNQGRPDCEVPVSERFHFHPSPPPVIVDLWSPSRIPPGDTFTTVGNWKQMRRQVRYKGKVYSWSKHFEFLKFLDVPARTGAKFELAMSSYEEQDRQLLESKGWKVRDALGFSRDMDAYRHYIQGSRGEFTVAKDQNVRLRSGWFSERAAQYLAAGRPVITQDTGFRNLIPCGEGLFAFSTMDEICAAVERIQADYQRHSRAAVALAREYFNYDVVLRRLLAEAGV
jgi:hypothetical protein